MRSIRLLLLLLPAALRAQWSLTDGPAGGAITRIGGDDRTMITSVGTMFYRSDDHGESWSAINSGLGTIDINQLATIGPHLFASSLRESWRWDPAGERWEPYQWRVRREGDA